MVTSQNPEGGPKVVPPIVDIQAFFQGRTGVGPVDNAGSFHAHRRQAKREAQNNPLQAFPVLLSIVATRADDHSLLCFE